NPGEISLIDPSGIAQISYLGDNKWRLSRIEFISGEVKIKSKVGDVEYSKSVIIGAKAPSILGGSKVVWSGNTYYYDVIKSDPNSSLNIEANSFPGMPYSISIIENRIKLETFNINSNVNDYLIKFKVTESNSCGVSIPRIYTVRFRGGEGPAQ